MFFLTRECVGTVELPTAAPSAASMPRMRRSDSQKCLNSSSVSASVRLGDKVFQVMVFGLCPIQTYLSQIERLSNYVRRKGKRVICF